MDMYLRILMAIDAEVVDRDIAHTQEVRNMKLLFISINVTLYQIFINHWVSLVSSFISTSVFGCTQEAQRNSMIKDAMRERCVNALADSWYQVMVCAILFFYFIRDNIFYSKVEIPLCSN